MTAILRSPRASLPARLILLFSLFVLAALVSPSDRADAGTCGAIGTLWPTPPSDGDCDGFSDQDGFAMASENHVGTLPFVTCPATGGGVLFGRNDEDPDPWPPDFDDNKLVNLGDITSFIAPVRRIDTSPGDANYSVRWDLLPGAGAFSKVINISDLTSLITGGWSRFLNSTCTITPAPPSQSVSRYMMTVDGETLWQEGCAQAESAPDNSIVVLNFGQPWINGSTYGVNLHDPNYTFVPIAGINTASVEEASRDYLRGFWVCSSDTPQKHVTLAIGTNNYQGSSGMSAASYYEHGRQWAQMVNRVNDWISMDPPYSSREVASGASDMELNWNSPPTTKAWADGFTAATQYWPYYNYGTADGCPTTSAGSPDDCGGPNYPEWTQGDVWYVAWHVTAAWPLPEIYLDDGSLAAQWYQLSRYARQQTGNRMDFHGVFTQLRACQIRTCRPDEDMPPAQAWSTLWTLTNADTNTSGSAFYWTTDITWEN